MSKVKIIDLAENIHSRVYYDISGIKVGDMLPFFTLSGEQLTCEVVEINEEGVFIVVPYCEGVSELQRIDRHLPISFGSGCLEDLFRSDVEDRDD